MMIKTNKKIIRTLAIGAFAVGSVSALQSATTMAATSTTTESTVEAGGFHKGRGGHGDAMNSEWINQLVTDGILDQDTADSLTAYQVQVATKRKAQMEAIRDMTAEERQAYHDAQQGTQHPEPFADAVTAGILTQDQADAIKAAMPQKRADESGFTRGDRPEGGRLHDFSLLVESGVIDQATADNMKAYLEEKRAEKPERHDMFTVMVTDGILTQDQADAIKATMPQRQAPAESSES